jgi:hypothetical protein
VARSFAIIATSLAIAGCAPTARPIWPPPRAHGPVHDPDLARGALPGEAARRAELAFVRDLIDRVYAHRLDKLARYQIDESALFADAERRLLAARTWAGYDGG